MHITVDINTEPGSDKFYYFVGLIDPASEEGMDEVGSGDTNTLESALKITNDMIRRTV